MNGKPVTRKSATTRQRIVQAAERLFAQKGFKAMTLRDVTREARVNLAAVNYHFGTKRDLIREVVRSRFEPINEARIQRLNESIERHSPDPVPVREIFEALFHPLFDSANTRRGPDRVLMQMIGRSLSEPADFLREMHEEFFAGLSQRFLMELKRSQPQLSDAALQYRFFFSVSTMLGAISDQVRLGMISRNRIDSTNIKTLVDELVAFVAAGFTQSDGNAR